MTIPVWFWTHRAFRARWQTMRRICALAIVFAALPGRAPAQDPAPHLFHVEGGVLARWIEDDEVQTVRFAAGKPIELPQFAGLLGEKVELVEHKPVQSSWPMPPKMLVISDVEGEYDSMFAFLRGNEVVDEAGRWQFGKGHLVTVGDMVDRGDQQTEVLWMLWRLQREAEQAGGKVHYLLGNHEVMQMAGDVRYLENSYKVTAQKFGIPPEGLLGADTEIGRWLRSCNSLLRIGPFFFVHAGISPAVGAAKLDLDAVNADLRGVLGVPPEEIEDQMVAALAWSRLGPFWYRGYFAEYALSFGPVPSVASMDKILTNLGAESIVIGHTKVEKVKILFGKRRVIAIDIPWTDLQNVRGLRVEGEKVEVVNHLGVGEPLK